MPAGNCDTIPESVAVSACPLGTQSEKCAEGYSQSSDVEGCHRCTLSDCPIGETLGGCENGYTAVDTANYSGKNRCHKCVAAECPSGSAVDKTCGEGWKTNKTLVDGASIFAKSGTEYCLSCVADSCKTGGTNVTCSDDETKVSTGFHSGNQPCYKCEKKEPIYALIFRTNDGLWRSTEPLSSSGAYIESYQCTFDETEDEMKNDDYWDEGTEMWHDGGYTGLGTYTNTSYCISRSREIAGGATVFGNEKIDRTDRTSATWIKNEDQASAASYNQLNLYDIDGGGAVDDAVCIFDLENGFEDDACSKNVKVPSATLNKWASAVNQYGNSAAKQLFRYYFTDKEWKSLGNNTESVCPGYSWNMNVKNVIKYQCLSDGSYYYFMLDGDAPCKDGYYMKNGECVEDKWFILQTGGSCCYSITGLEGEGIEKIGEFESDNFFNGKGFKYKVYKDAKFRVSYDKNSRSACNNTPQKVYFAGTELNNASDLITVDDNFINSLGDYIPWNDEEDWVQISAQADGNVKNCYIDNKCYTLAHDVVNESFIHGYKTAYDGYDIRDYDLFVSLFAPIEYIYDSIENDSYDEYGVPYGNGTYTEYSAYYALLAGNSAGRDYGIGIFEGIWDSMLDNLEMTVRMSNQVGGVTSSEEVSFPISEVKGQDRKPYNEFIQKGPKNDKFSQDMINAFYAGGDGFKMDITFKSRNNNCMNEKYTYAKGVWTANNASPLADISGSSSWGQYRELYSYQNLYKYILPYNAIKQALMNRAKYPGNYQSVTYDYAYIFANTGSSKSEAGPYGISIPVKMKGSEINEWIDKYGKDKNANELADALESRIYMLLPQAVKHKMNILPPGSANLEIEDEDVIK